MRARNADSLPAVQIDATLFFADDPIDCDIDSRADDRFCVAVDARIFFKNVGGRVDVIRVLPIEFEGDGQQ